MDTTATDTATPTAVLYDYRTAADMLSVPRSWLEKRVAARLVPHRRLGRHVRFDMADIDAIKDMYAQPVLVLGG